MENRKLVILLSFIIFVFPTFVFAYEPETAHRGLTHDIIRYFEYFYPNKLSGDDKQAIEKGAVDEDNGARALNHFYDPVYDKGILHTSKEWATNTLAQARTSVSYTASLGNIANAYFSSQSDYSWERAIYEYAHGDKNRGMKSLGHILHLIEDATVPDHTRDDPHPPFFDKVFEQESPYEHFTNRFTANNINVSKKLITEGRKPTLYNSLGEYFDKLATYSNSNFFSKDTIFSKKYKGPTIIFEKTDRLSNNEFYNFGYSTDNNKNFKLVRIKKEVNLKEGIFDISYFIDDYDHLILTDYWNLLSEAAVQNGAGVIKLFFDEVEKERKTLALYDKNKSWLERQIGAVASAFSVSSPITLDKIASNSETRGAGVTESTTQTNPDIILVSAQATDEINANNESVFIEIQPQIENPPSPMNAVPSPSTDDVTTPKINFGSGLSPGFGGGAAPPLPAINTGDIPQTNSEGDNGQNSNSNNQDQSDGNQDNGGNNVAQNQNNDQNSSQNNTPALLDSPTIISPADLSRPFFTTTITFTGTSSPAFVISNSLTSATTTADNSGNWALTFINLSEGTTTVSFIAEDTTGATSSPREVSFATVMPRPAAPTITSPTFPLELLNAVSATFTGSSTPGFAIFNDYTNATTTTDTSGSWLFNFSNFSEGTTTINFYATDQSGMISHPRTVSFNVYNIFPIPANLTVGECAHSLSPSPNLCTLPVGKATLSWDMVTPNYSYFEILKGVIVSGQTTYSLFATTTATSTIISTNEADYSYDFKVRAVDIFGARNLSTGPTTLFFISHSPPVSITEIAWAGTDASVSDQWIEIKNNTPYDIDLSNFSLHSTGGLNTVLFGTIPDLGYLIMDLSPDAHALSNVSAASTSLPYMLSTSGEVLSLVFDGGVSSTTVDQTPQISDCDGWCGGSFSGHVTMERRQTETAGADKNNWLSNNTTTVNGTDRNGVAVNGTPGSQNSVSVGRTGFYCTPYTSSFVENGSYAPNVSTGYISCWFLSPGFSDGAYRVGALYKGAVGNAVYLDGWNNTGDASVTRQQTIHTDPANFVSGENYFSVIREVHPNEINPNTNTNVFDDFFTGANGVVSPPHNDYGVINWIYGP